MSAGGDDDAAASLDIDFLAVEACGNSLHSSRGRALAVSDANHKWLADHGVIPVTYADGVEDRIRAVSGGKLDAFIDTFGGGYVELALKLGVAPNRIDTIIDFAAAVKYGVKTEGNHEGATADVLAQLAGLLAAGRLEIPIAKVYPLAEVRDAYRELEQRHTRGKIVLEPLEP
jgi:NADPH:quinone reductase-like Zn-dependent oxidoreductase